MPAMSKNYFELFGLPQTFTVDIEKLSSSYHALQLEHHPDKVAGAGEQEKMQAIQFASFLNSAYEALNNPLSRAGYLLSLSDVDIEQVSQSDLGMDLLMEQMQLRESLADLPKDESSLSTLDELKKEVQAKIKNREVGFIEFIDSANLIGAKKLYHEMQFLFKLLSEIEAGEDLRLGY